MTLLKMFLFLLELASSVKAQGLFINLRCRSSQTKTGCFLGVLGYAMRQGDGADCIETCSIFPLVKTGWQCGNCNEVVPTSPTPPAVPTPTPPTPFAPAAPSNPSPMTAPPTYPTNPLPVATPTKPIGPAPIAAPTMLSPPTLGLPAGPYIAAGYSERIKLPQPAEPNLSTASRSNCPHVTSPGLKNWHSASTWPSGVVPKAGQAATLPFNSQVVIQKNVIELLGVITIPVNSSLIIGEAAGGIELKTRGIDVQGSLIAGSETCRIETPIAITLHGIRPSDAVLNRPTETFKGISVTGTLSLHGKRYFRTWTRLSKTVYKGESVLLLQNPVNWEPGQKIVLVTTAMKDSREWHQNEVHTIAAVNSPSPVMGIGAAVYLSDPVQYQHIANSGYQAEVGLLTRTITIQGSAIDSEPTDLDPLTCSVPYDERFGDKGAPCGYTEITGFGGHVIVHSQGRGFVEGVEFYRMGQTNVLGRYPMHFHLLGNCPQCYVRDSSFHRSYYRCVSIHGTNQATLSENVAYDVTGYCYYLEDGVEEYNTLSFNLAAYIHAIGPEPPGGSGGQTTNIYQQGPNLTLPADVTAAGFYITNVRNNIIGNAASGGWAGFAFPVLKAPLQTFRNDIFRPSSVTGLTIDGNSAHSSGWWWGHAGAFYFGGALYYNGTGVLEYNPGRSFSHDRRPCKVNACALGDCDYGCPVEDRAFIRITNSKTFLVSGVGFNSWSGAMEVVGWESHDTGLSLESLAEAFWIDNALAVCRTGEDLAVPTVPQAWERMHADGFFWYDTGQEHIITGAVFRNCGYRSDEFNQYDTSTDRGCGDSDSNGCSSDSTVFGFLTHSDEFTPEIMQGTRDITFDNCGRRFSLDNWLRADSVSWRAQNWLDTDGSASGLGVPTLLVSGAASASHWWNVDDKVVYDPQGPLRFIATQPRVGAPVRGLGHISILWDQTQHDQVGQSICGNGNGKPCPALGFFRHAGKRFSVSGTGLAVTARGDIVGPVGGFGWILELDGGAPRNVRIENVEVLPETPLLISIAYPVGTTFTITAHAADWCWTGSKEYSCSEVFTKAGSLKQVRTGPGNQYFVDSSGVVTFRIVQLPQNYVGRPGWFIPSRTDLGQNGKGYAVERFERSGVYLPHATYGPYMTLDAVCGGSAPYCSETPKKYDPDVCPSGFQQLAYDYCCSTSNASSCVFAGGA